MKIRKMIIKMVMSLLLVIMSSGHVMGADATLGVDVNSAYVWRGITFNDGAVVQPSIDVTKGGLGVNVWGNFDINDFVDYDGDGTSDDGQFSEFDVTLSYGFTVDKIDFSVGYIEYTWGAVQGDAAREVFASVSTSPIEGLSIGLDAYYEIDTIEDFYLSLGICYEFFLNDDFGIECGASAGFMGEDYSAGGTDGGLNDYNISLSASYALAEDISFTATVAYTDAIDDDVLPDSDTNTGILGVDTTFYGGISLGYTF